MVYCPLVSASHFGLDATHRLALRLSCRMNLMWSFYIIQGADVVPAFVLSTGLEGGLYAGHVPTDNRSVFVLLQQHFLWMNPSKQALSRLQSARCIFSLSMWWLLVSCCLPELCNSLGPECFFLNWIFCIDGTMLWQGLERGRVLGWIKYS